MKKYYFITSSLLFLVIGLASCSDQDGKSQNQTASRPAQPISSGSVVINTQNWLTKNLNVTRYRNGDQIPQVADATEWENLTTGAWCYYNNDPTTLNAYGRLYNWYALHDPRGITPVGWHVPNKQEWDGLITYLGVDASWKLMAVNSWTGVISATNSSGFTALPSGKRDGVFLGINHSAYFWTSTEDIFNTYAYAQSVSGNNTTMSTYLKNVGMSVRCLQNRILDVDNNVYVEVPIGTQTWTNANLNVSRYRNGDAIPEVTDPTQWNNLTTGAWCYYNNDPANGLVYGKLYNWYAVNDPRGLAPEGWHVPSIYEFITLRDYIGYGICGRKLRSTSLWRDVANNPESLPFFQGYDSYRFSARPGGARDSEPYSFISIEESSDWWTSTSQDGYAYYFFTSCYVSGMGDYGSIFNNGKYVRIVRD